MACSNGLLMSTRVVEVAMFAGPSTPEVAGEVDIEEKMVVITVHGNELDDGIDSMEYLLVQGDRCE